MYYFSQIFFIHVFLMGNLFLPKNIYLIAKIFRLLQKVEGMTGVYLILYVSKLIYDLYMESMLSNIKSISFVDISNLI